jgi:multimeric flavodoxin WrbA
MIIGCVTRKGGDPMGPQKILIVLGSPRKNGNTATLAEALAKGAGEAGAEVERFYLQGMSIHPCTGCDKCQEETDQLCVIDDDMQTLYGKVEQADTLVIATPVYWFTVSAQTKLFMDRLYALGGPDGYSVLEGKRIGIILAYADPDPFVSGAVNALRTFQDAFRYVGADIVGMVYGSASKAGEIKQNKDVMEKAYQLGGELGSHRP